MTQSTDPVAVEALRAYVRHKNGCLAEYCRVCSRHPDSDKFGGCLRGGRLDDGDCENDKHGLHVFEPIECTCGLDALLSAVRQPQMQEKTCQCGHGRERHYIDGCDFGWIPEAGVKWRGTALANACGCRLFDPPLAVPAGSPLSGDPIVRTEVYWCPNGCDVAIPSDTDGYCPQCREELAVRTADPYEFVRVVFATRGRCQWHDTELLEMLSPGRRGQFYCALCANENRVTKNAVQATGSPLKEQMWYDFEMAVWGKIGNTFEVNQMARIEAFFEKYLAAGSPLSEKEKP